MPIRKRSILLRDLRNYLTFLKDYGFSEIPSESGVTLELQSGTKGLPYSSIDTDKTSHMKTNKNITTKPNISIEDVREELGDCTRCNLHKDRKTIVFGSGNPHADLVFVGEGPGADEDEQGFPFVGRAGRKLTEIIEKGMNLRQYRKMPAA